MRFFEILFLIMFFSLPVFSKNNVEIIFIESKSFNSVRKAKDISNNDLSMLLKENMLQLNKLYQDTPLSFFSNNKPKISNVANSYHVPKSFDEKVKIINDMKDLEKSKNNIFIYLYPLEGSILNEDNFSYGEGTINEKYIFIHYALEDICNNRLSTQNLNKSILAHEIGHSYGLHHNDDADHLMYKETKMCSRTDSFFNDDELSLLNITGNIKFNKLHVDQISKKSLLYILKFYEQNYKDSETVKKSLQFRIQNDIFRKFRSKTESDLENSVTQTIDFLKLIHVDYNPADMYLYFSKYYVRIEKDLLKCMEQLILAKKYAPKDDYINFYYYFRSAQYHDSINSFTKALESINSAVKIKPTRDSMLTLDEYNKAIKLQVKIRNRN